MKHTYYIDRIEGDLMDVTPMGSRDGMYLPGEIIVHCRNRAGTFDMVWTDRDPPRIGQAIVVEAFPLPLNPGD